MRKPESSSNPEFIALSGQFEEFDELVEFSAAWEVDFRQVDRGLLNATLSQAVGDSWSFAKARFDRTAYQQGVALPGMRTFAILDPSAPGNDWCGHWFSADTIAVFAKAGEFQSVSKPGFDVYTISFTDEQLADACERLGIPDITEKLSAGESILQIDHRQTGNIRQKVNSALHALCKTGLEGSVWVGSNHMRDEISEHIVLLLSSGSSLSRTPKQQLRSRTLRHAFEIIEAGLEKGLSVREVAKTAGVSRRTLEYAFRDRYDLSPKAFINSQRLAMARRSLRSKPHDVPIVEIANRWGFWHMGQFASDYQRQYGELPSQTGKS